MSKSVKYKKKVILCAIIILKMIEEGKTLLSFMEVFIVGGKYTTHKKYKIKERNEENEKNEENKQNILSSYNDIFTIIFSCYCFSR